uniref:Protein-glutamine gamma-glutamyltransferase-like C-terminal domain-containing protein n=1 Tax=uncultured bacterium CSLG10 TaxID=1091576 RepID=G4WV61_9BACT|nr:hypothetical protein [uncultured bacterium CSLG10]
MKPLISCWILLTIAGGIVPVSGQYTGQQASSASYTPASLALELRRVKRTLQESGDAQALPALPLAWQVETPDRSYSISSEPLPVLLARQTDPKEQARNNVKAAAWLDHLADYLEGSGTAFAGSRSQERTELTRILARPEFAGNAPPTRWDLFQQRVLTWIREMLDRIFSFAAQHPSGSKILFWVVITGAIGILGNWLLRLWTRGNQTMSLTAPGLATRVRTWEEWFRASRAAADQGDPREAIRLAYWAGVMRLQELRLLPVHTSQTPRENLRLLSEPKPGAAPASPAFRESLSGLTSGLERFWYARRLAGPEDFRESLRHLEALGCKVD